MNEILVEKKLLSRFYAMIEIKIFDLSHYQKLVSKCQQKKNQDDEKC